MNNKVFIVKQKRGIFFKKITYSVSFQDESAARDNNTSLVNSLEECYAIIDYARANGYNVSTEIEVMES